jgi:hypothetical protein
VSGAIELSQPMELSLEQRSDCWISCRQQNDASDFPHLLFSRPLTIFMPAKAAKSVADFGDGFIQSRLTLYVVVFPQ